MNLTRNNGTPAGNGTQTQTQQPYTFTGIHKRLLRRADYHHGRTPYLRVLPLRAILIILLLVVINLIVWAICALVLIRHPHLLSTAALAYTLGLRHALDADHISAIDLMTRRLVASGKQPVTVGTFFSLGHSTIVVITSIVVAATAAGISKKFSGFSNIGGIIGTSVSAAFLIILGILNAYILYKLLTQLRKVIHLQPEQELDEGFKVEGGGVIFRVLKRLFKLIDRPWKMYPLGVLFGLGFDTSSEVALLGISSLQGSKGTSIWLILIFPVLFTVGMCLIDTIDGALMMSLYVAPTTAEDRDIKTNERGILLDQTVSNPESPVVSLDDTTPRETHNLRVKSPLTFLYYSSVLTFLTVAVALVIGTIQLLTLILNVAVSEDTADNSKFWQGVQAAGDNYDIIGGGICAAFVVFGVLSVLFYKPFRRWVDSIREEERSQADRGVAEVVQGEQGHDSNRVEETEASPIQTTDTIAPGRDSRWSVDRKRVLDISKATDYSAA